MYPMEARKIDKDPSRVEDPAANSGKSATVPEVISPKLDWKKRRSLTKVIEKYAWSYESDFDDEGNHIEGILPMGQQKKAFVFSIDGIKGGGKTRLFNNLAQRFLEEHSIDFQLFRESNEEANFTQARHAYEASGEPNQRVMLHAVTAARIAAIESKLVRSLTDPHVIGWMRSWVTTLAMDYLETDEVKHRPKEVYAFRQRTNPPVTIRSIAGSYPLADLAIILLIDPWEAKRRIIERSRDTGREEKLTHTLDKLVQLNEAYKILAPCVPNSCVIDTTKYSEEEVRELASQAIYQRMKLTGTYPKIDLSDVE